MVIIRLPSGNLLVPEYALTRNGRVLGDAYVEIGPGHAEFERFREEAITQEEDAARRQRWRDGDDALRREFLDYLARNGASGGWHDAP